VPVTPEYISDLVNFQSTTLEKEWAYNPERTDMRNLQVKGAARVFNLLESQKLALLADEVGMGKTIQALTVCAALWREKPQARVLILAPRDEIAHNWEREYQTFIAHHYRHEDNIVKSISGQEPMKRMIYCANLYSLVQEVKQGWGQLFIGKISSFSSLMTKKDVVSRLESVGIRKLAKVRDLASRSLSYELNSEIAELLKAEIDHQSPEGKPYFDLLIIDEAHYFRNSEGGSLRAESGRLIFGDPSQENYSPLASKVLLMTATPNHSSSKDIGNIIGYFTKKYQGKNYNEVLETLCVRRLRRLSSKGFNKYNYRSEIPSPSNFKDNPLGEMFFGLYQHELAKALNRNKNERRGKKGVSRMMKYLEGVEFIPFEKNVQQGEGVDEEEATAHSSDYRTGEDSGILLDISRKFREIFAEMPKHPKYDKLVEDLTTKNRDEKCVVFVRRIPSVFEIAKRVIEFYDRRMWEQLRTGPLESLRYEKLTRGSFKNRSAVTDKEDDELSDDTVEAAEAEGNIPSCAVLNLFRVVKNHPVKSTPASNFRLRFNHSKSNIFAMFFSPGADYFATGYKGMTLHRFDVGRDEIENFYSSALLHRANAEKEEAASKDVLSLLLPKNPSSIKGEVAESLPTLLTIFWDSFLQDEGILSITRQQVESGYRGFSTYEKESFSNFLEKGVLLASESVVLFYKIFRQAQGTAEENQVQAYLRFCEALKAELKTHRLYYQIQESVLHFKSIYTKVFSINSTKALVEESWESFGSAQPIYPYNADNSSQKVLRCFNTPFYPDMLVATSVLQEGVNLQFFCNTIYHYGMAWTPGENEQRIGRIDRMFGKIERRLEADVNASLDIYYPYLKDTIDEEHLSRFAKRKYNEEALIDKGKAFEEGADFVMEENNNDSWKLFLRSPQTNNISDPFPVTNDQFKGVKAPKLLQVKSSLDDFYESIAHSLEQLTDLDPKVYYIRQEGSQKKLLVDPTMPTTRKQPVVIELLFDHVGSGYHGKSVYCLRMRTPLASTGKFRDRKLRAHFIESISIQGLYGPGTKFCLDPSQTGGSSWGLYMAQELPLFDVDLKDNPLSSGEVQQAFVQLIRCADQVEKELFNQDLQREALNLSLELLDAPKKQLRQTPMHPGETGWKREGTHLVKEQPLILSPQEPLKEAAVANHCNFHVRVFNRGNEWIAQVAIREIDAQAEERSILEKHLRVFMSTRNWLSKTGEVNS
jgi:hypothetical protein